MTDNSRRTRDGGSSQERKPPERRAPVMGDDLPQILEVFGAAPLVRDSQAQKKEAPAAMTHGTTRDLSPLPDDPADWDPLASVEDPEADPSDAPDAPDAAARGHARSRSVGFPPSATETPDAGLGALDDLVRQSDERLGRIELGVRNLSQQSQFLPPKLRGLAKKVDEIAVAVGDVRVRSLLVELVGLGDLVDGALKALPEQDSGAIGGARRFFRALGTRIDQMLEAHDTRPIAVDGGFDPTVHNAVDVLDVDDPALEGQIVELVRPGFRTEHSVLRYAEVAVGRYRTSADVDERARRTEDAATRLGVRLSSLHDAGSQATKAASSGCNDPLGTRRKTPPDDADTTKDHD